MFARCDNDIAILLWENSSLLLQTCLLTRALAYITVYRSWTLYLIYSTVRDDEHERSIDGYLQLAMIPPCHSIHQSCASRHPYTHLQPCSTSGLSPGIGHSRVEERERLSVTRTDRDTTQHSGKFLNPLQ